MIVRAAIRYQFEFLSKNGKNGQNHQYVHRLVLIDYNGLKKRNFHFPPKEPQLMPPL